MENSLKWVPKGWGGEKWIVNNDKYCGKLLYFVKGKKCSLHYHKLKDETFYIQSGKIRLLYSDNLEFFLEKSVEQYPFVGIGCFEIILTKGDSFHIPPGRVHQMIALEDAELFEFSTQHFDEDSYRIIKGD